MHQPMHRLGKESPMNGNETEIQAGEWLARLDRNDPSAADLAEFDQWKSRGPAQRRCLRETRGDLAGLGSHPAIRPSAD